MAKVTVFFGVVLIILGVVFYIHTGSKFPTSLIPVPFGILLATFGGAAETPVPKRRMLFMHIAVTIGLLGFLGTAPALFQVVPLVKGTRLFPFPAAIEEKAAMSALMFIYVLLCVRSFITARRSRV